MHGLRPRPHRDPGERGARVRPRRRGCVTINRRRPSRGRRRSALDAAPRRSTGRGSSRSAAIEDRGIGRGDDGRRRGEVGVGVERQLHLPRPAAIGGEVADDRGEAAGVGDGAIEQPADVRGGGRCERLADEGERRAGLLDGAIGAVDPGEVAGAAVSADQDDRAAERRLDRRQQVEPVDRQREPPQAPGSTARARRPARCRRRTRSGGRPCAGVRSASGGRRRASGPTAVRSRGRAARRARPRPSAAPATRAGRRGRHRAGRGPGGGGRRARDQARSKGRGLAAMKASASAREDAGGGADGADAARARGAGELQAGEFVEAVEQAGDVAGVEGVAAAGAVDEGDGVGRPGRTARSSESDDHALLALGDHDPAGAQVAEGPGLADRVGLAQDQRRLVGVGQEDVGVRQDRFERLEVVGRARGRRRPAR